MDQVLPNLTALLFERNRVRFADLLVSLEFLLSLRFLANSFVRKTKPVMCFRKQRIQLQRTLICAHRRLEIAPLGM
jgi:hypothetical protein